MVTTGNQSFGFVGGYIPPDDTTTTQFTQQAMEYQTDGMPVFLMGDLNANLNQAGGGAGARDCGPSGLPRIGEYFAAFPPTIVQAQLWRDLAAETRGYWHI